jgi:hypothetical protein
MLFWQAAMMLALDAAIVMEKRLQMIASGRSTPSEMLLMVSEKLDAMEDAQRIIAGGGNPSHVVDNYRKIVAANVARLSER